MNSTSEIQSLVSDFAAQLSNLVRRTALEQVMAALGGDAPAARRGPGRPKGGGAAYAKAKRSGKRIRRSPEDLAQLSDSLLAHVKANPGQRGKQIAAALSTDVGTMRGPMKALIAAKQVRTEGQRRGMTYFAGGGKARKAGPGKKAKRGGKRKAA